ncbi:MAG: hypothetical protein QOI78_3840 [Actinomycetota bacterium]|jgi:hypothetical protein|nr:hypothetical protein [Actinomycetota bacterium]
MFINVFICASRALVTGEQLTHVVGDSSGAGSNGHAAVRAIGKVGLSAVSLVTGPPGVHDMNSEVPLRTQRQASRL